MIDILSSFFLLAAIPFFIAGTVGLLRLPDVYTRLHALTKADTIGLGLIVVGLILQATTLFEVVKLLLIWLLVLLASATTCHLVAEAALQRGLKPWQKP